MPDGALPDHDEQREDEQTQTHYYAVHSLQLAKSLPDLRVGPEGFFSGIARMVGVHDIEFESEDFNRVYKVTSDDRKFASDVVNPQLMQFLLDGRAAGLSIIGPDIVVVDKAGWKRSRSRGRSPI